MKAIISKYLFRQIVASFISSSLGISAGLTLGITATLLPQLKKDASFPYHEYYDSWIASISLVSTTIGTFSIGALLDAYGRKLSHILLIIPYITGWLIMAFANDINILLIGRFLNGLSAGAFRAISLVYVGEICDPTFRPLALNISSLIIHVGVSLVHVFCYYLPWRTGLLVCTTPAVATILLICLLKESPLWLISKGKIEEGSKTFIWFRGPSEASKEELKMILEKRKDTPEEMKVQDFIKTLLDPSFVKPCLILFVLNAEGQFNGAYGLIFYSQLIFEATFPGELDAFVLMISTDTVRLITAVLLCVFSAKMLRRPSVLTSSFATVIGLCGLILFQHVDAVKSLVMSIICIVFYIISSSAFGTLAWPIIPELYPNQIRGFGSGLSLAIAAVQLFVFVKTLPGILATCGIAGMYGVYAVITVICSVILCFVLPETNGLTLQEIENSFSVNKNDLTV